MCQSLFPNVEGFSTSKQEAHREYTFDDNFECTPQINMLSWTLSNGIITATNGTAIDRWVIRIDSKSLGV
jgi:hypothetical protein